VDTVDRDNDSTIPAKPIQKRRQYSNALKRHIVEQNLADHDSVSVAARRYDVNANQLFKWRRQYRAGFLVDEPEPQSLVPITRHTITSIEVRAGDCCRDGARHGHSGDYTRW
jgi:transposase